MSDINTSAPVDGANTANTQPQAAIVDMESISQIAQTRAERAATAAVKSMLKQEGLDTENINKMLEEWKSKQQTPEQVLQQKDQDILNLQRVNDDLKEQMLLLGRRIPAEKSAQYHKLAKTYVDDQTDFATALDKALADFPIAEPRQSGGSGFEGANPPNQKPDYVSMLEKARENGDIGEQIRIKSEAFDKEKIVLF